jgi:membrane associated rhomboid family serine protease
LPAPRRPWPALAALALLALPELVLQLADRGLLGSPLWRSLAYQNGAFWPGLLDTWQPNFAAQPVTMFLSYALLHVGFAHLLGNLLALALLWQLAPAAGGPGPGRVALVAAGAALGAALCFAALYRGSGSMVGASGVVFGLAGAAIVWRWQARPAGSGWRAHGEAAGLGVGLLALDALSGLSQAGPVASEAHLGGALSGAALALLLGRQRA